ncbi:decaprenylphospho-beta-D-erythro-pentofuranosid-2-ulose 2-reductase [Kineococcus rhizosphaerae]|uniref:Decaprenylphospho-beta-D-erythro-pentofuranosid-2-ulose 2-reductase n=1 Tax=Kineococcus rhizosphaerae TaxID=559628 RepID=A0A2T0R090_9ACTN|nr:decaprenylphospho-beta-D-erythro-pentofuranosid-2-ulose 2-reductase [Kineococcus rhizosphaerae]PRY12562.1 decaprenylphospho-beta-D-erythro-pentofuranosid-2-ulose 2-reductase [Kineococcus rhizosphaerae]
MIDALGNPRSVLLLGGTSDIGLAIVERLSPERPLQVTLAARPGARREEAVARLHRRGHEVRTVDFEATALETHAQVVEECFDGGDVDVTVLAFGVLGDNEVSWQDADAAVRVATVNYTAPVNLGVHLAAKLKLQGHGVLVALSSVAGERARRSNFVYGSSKAGFDAFFTGLREALRPSGVRVVVVRPGFVHTKMTEGLKTAPLSVSAEQVAEVAVDAVRTGKETVWAPEPMRWVMSALRHVPAPVFRKLSL